MSSIVCHYCTLCGYDCDYNNSLEDHLQALRNNREQYIKSFIYKCELCDFYCNVAYSYRNHLVSNSHLSNVSFEAFDTSRVANTSGG